MTPGQRNTTLNEKNYLNEFPKYCYYQKQRATPYMSAQEIFKYKNNVY